MNVFSPVRPSLPATSQPLSVNTSPSVHALQPHRRTSADRPALAIISHGGARANRRFMESPSARPSFPTHAIYCDELPGATPQQRGLALLDEIRALRAAGVLANDVPAILYFHGDVEQGELMLSDEAGSFSLPAIVLLHCLSKPEEFAPSVPSRPAPILLSCCHAKAVLPALDGIARPVLLNGGKHEIEQLDAECVIQRTLAEVEAAWRHGEPLSADTLFDALGRTSGETLRLVEPQRCVVHHPLRSAASADEVSGSQEILYLRATLSHGSADKLAEALQFFGLQGLHAHFLPSHHPVLWYLVNAGARELYCKIGLLLALGEPIDQANAEGSTLLHDACCCDADEDDWEISECVDGEVEAIGSVTLAKLLLANGADPLAVNHSGFTARDLAFASGNPALIALFAEDADRSDDRHYQPAALLARARREGRTALVALLESAGICDDGRSARGAARLGQAAQPPQISENSDS